MAKVQFGSGVAYMSGRVAGTVHARNKGGCYVRRFSVPVNPSTTFQQQIRNNLSASSSGFRNLSPAEQAAWAAWAETHPVIDRLGAAIRLTAQQAFVAVNRNAFSNGDGDLFYSLPPVEPEYEFPFEAGFTVAVDGGAGTMTISQTVQPAADTQVFVYASPAVSPGITNAKALTKFLGPITVLAITAVPVAVTIAAAWVVRYGSIHAGLVGRKVIIGLRTYSNGQLSGTVGSFGLVVP